MTTPPLPPIDALRLLVDAMRQDGTTQADVTTAVKHAYATLALYEPAPPRDWWPHTVKELRESLGWTQRELAEAMGVASIQVSRWERGERVPNPGNRAQLSRIAQGVEL